jgi:hypothetical protein
VAHQLCSEEDLPKDDERHAENSLDSSIKFFEVKTEIDALAVIGYVLLAALLFIVGSLIALYTRKEAISHSSSPRRTPRKETTSHGVEDNNGNKSSARLVNNVVVDL